MSTSHNTINITGSNQFRNITLKQLQKSRKKLVSALKGRWNPFLSGALLYFLPFMLLTIYGGKACPFIEGTPFNTIMLYIFISIFPLYIIRSSILLSYGNKKVLEWSDKKYMLFEASFFIIWVGILALFAMYLFQFSSESFIKITVGSGLLSVFSIIDLFLIRRKHLLLLTDNDTMSMNKEKILKQYNYFLSLKLKFIISTVLVLLLVGLAFSLINFKNYEWLIANINIIPHDEGLLSVFKETVFVIGVFMGQLVVTVILYSNNIIICFTMLNRVIGDLFEGKFDNQLLTLSNDEFGMMGENLNIISDELKEKQKIKNAFGKLVSPRVAELMLNDKELQLGGREKEIVMLFSDVRNYTNSSQHSSPTEVISKLNNYFTNMVQLVEQYDGIVDKFMGDGLMAIYGYDDHVKGVNNAVISAFEMLKAVKKEGSIKIGVGIHVGNAILGMIGSPQRLDFTAIGSNVNLAARLEAATKDNGVDIFLSEQTYDLLQQKVKNLGWRKFSIQVKGIEHTLTTYGLKVL